MNFAGGHSFASGSAKQLRHQNSDKTFVFTESEFFIGDNIDTNKKPAPKDSSNKNKAVTYGFTTDRELDTIQSLVQKIDETCTQSIFDKVQSSPKRSKSPQKSNRQGISEDQPIINFEFKNGGPKTAALAQNQRG